MNTTELTERLRDATDGLDVPPDFAAGVLRGGRRRRARRRITVAASVVAVVAVAAGATVVSLREDTAAPVADARLTMPAKGDLAGDQAFLEQVREAWQRDLPYAPEARDRYYDDLRGEPHVYWAGDTPAGRAAVVLQQVYVHPNSQVPEKGLRTAEGLVAVDPADGQLKIVGTRSPSAGQPSDAHYYKFGPGDRTVLVIDDGAPIHYTHGYEVEGTSTIRFDWQRAKPVDGAVLLTVPAGSKPRMTIVMQGDAPERTPALAAPYVPLLASAYLSQRLSDPSIRLDSEVLDWGERVWRLGEPVDLTPAELDMHWGYYRPYTGDPELVVSLWTIVARLPDGRVFILKESQQGSAAPRIVARLADNQDATTWNLADGGAVETGAVLPVRFKVPDGGGWIVADRGKELSYRTSAGAPWQKVGRDAALLPEDAAEVLVGDHFVRL